MVPEAPLEPTDSGLVQAGEGCADSGLLAITSTPVVFLGNRKTIEIPYSKLLGVEVFTDGIRFSASNRQNAPLFRLENGDVVAATVNTAVQHFNA